jgi:hypothetical protein
MLDGFSQERKAACEPPLMLRNTSAAHDRSCVTLDRPLDALDKRLEAFDG